MILSGREIERAVGTDIIIEPFERSKVNPNSYNLTLHNELLVYENEILDMKKPNPTKKLVIPEEGLLLEPNKLYLGRTKEFTTTSKYVPMLEGRSSTGRLGLCIHVTAGFGDIGFAGYWTLEIYCIHPLIIYPDIEVCQIYYHTIKGDYDLYSSGKYQNNTGIQPSLMYKDFMKDTGTDHNVLCQDAALDHALPAASPILLILLPSASLIAVSFTVYLYILPFSSYF